MKYFKYKDLEDCLLHASDRMAHFAEHVGYAKEGVFADEQLAKVYASGLLFLNEWNREKSQKIKENRYLRDEIEATLPAVAEYEDVAWMNELMHILHVENPSLRKTAIDIAVDTLTIISDDITTEFEQEYYFSSYGEHITGKEPFPEELRNEVEKIVSNYDDVVVRYEVTWQYSHYDCGEDYMYTEDEIPYVKIKALNKESLSACLKSLDKIQEDLEKKYEKDRKIEVEEDIDDDFEEEIEDDYDEFLSKANQQAAEINRQKIGHEKREDFER